MIAGAIVYDEKFKVLKTLIQYAFNGGAEIAP
jgi:hypothetical protein